MRHRASQHTLKQLIVFNLLHAPVIVRICVKIDLRYSLTAQRTVLIFGEPLLNTPLMEKVLVRIAGHADDFAHGCECFTTDQAIFH